MTSTLLLTTLLALSPPQWVPQTYSQPSTTSASQPPWWTDARFPGLGKLIEEALTNNGELSTARSQLAQASALKSQARSPLLPSLSADSSLSAAPTESLGFQLGGGMGAAAQASGGTLPDVYYTGATTIRGNYVVDLAGRNYLNYRAAKQNESAAQFDVERGALTLAVQITEAYLDIILAREQLQIQKDLLRANQDFLDVISLRFAKGEVSAVEVLQQKGQVATAASQIPLAIASINNSQRRLGLWLGQPFATPLSKSLIALPTDGPDPDPGIPAGLLHHHPGLKSAAMRLLASSNAAKSALRHHLPVLNLSGQVGKQYLYSNDLITQSFWGAGATLSLPLFSGFADQAAIEIAQAQAQGSRHTYEEMYRRAIMEVETTLTTFDATGSQLAEIEVALYNTQKAYEKSRQRYLSGVGDYVSTLTALQLYQQNKLNTLAVKRRRLSAEIQLRAAIGGAWTTGLGTTQRGKS